MLDFSFLLKLITQYVWTRGKTKKTSTEPTPSLGCCYSQEEWRCSHHSGFFLTCSRCTVIRKQGRGEFYKKKKCHRTFDCPKHGTSYLPALLPVVVFQKAVWPWLACVMSAQQPQESAIAFLLEKGRAGGTLDLITSAYTMNFKWYAAWFVSPCLCAWVCVSEVFLCRVDSGECVHKSVCR